MSSKLYVMYSNHNNPIVIFHVIHLLSAKHLSKDNMSGKLFLKLK